MTFMVCEGDVLFVSGLGLCRVGLVLPNGACIACRKSDRTRWLLAADLVDAAGLVSFRDISNPSSLFAEEDE